MNLLEQIAQHLAFCGFGRTAGAEANIYWGRMPDQPDDCVCVYSTDSALAGGTQGARIQLVNRSPSPRRAYETAVEMAEALDGFDGFLAGEGALARIDVVSAAAGLGADAKKREMYAVNILVRYCPAVAENAETGG